MKPQTRIWLVLLIGLAAGYAAGVTTMLELRTLQSRRPPPESPELVVARKRLADLRMTFTDESTFVRAQLQKVQQLQQQGHKP